jgi:hypothetical protein
MAASAQFACEYTQESNTDSATRQTDANGQPWGARSFGGGILEGNKLVRIAYLDEAGISNPAHEPWIVVGGIILHADEHWRPLEEHFRALARRYLPNDPKPLFHAQEIFHGTGKFDRNSNQWPRNRREHLLSELIEIPRKFDLPVVMGFHHREQFAKQILKNHPAVTPAACNTITHADTFCKAAAVVDGWMNRVVRNETAMIIAEDTPRMKKALKFLHGEYTNRYREIGTGGKVFHSSHIVETVHFAAKSESMPLQIADACAFVFKRHLMDKVDADAFIDVLRPQIVWHAENAIVGASDDLSRDEIIAQVEHVGFPMRAH